MFVSMSTMTFPLKCLRNAVNTIEAKKVLKEKQIKFQTPYPAKMRIFYDDGTQLFQNAVEATKDMSAETLSPLRVPRYCGEVFHRTEPRGDPAPVCLAGGWEKGRPGRESGACHCGWQRRIKTSALSF